MTKRTRVIVAAIVIIAGGLAAALLVAVLALETDAGHERLARAVMSIARGRLAPGVDLQVGRLDGGLRRAWTMDSVVLTDAQGRAIARINRVSAGLVLTSFLRGEIRLGTVIIDGADLLLEQRRDRSWNVTGLFSKPDVTAPLTSPRRTRVIRVDSLEVRNSRLVVSRPDTVPTRPNIRQEFTKLRFGAGAATLTGPDGAGGLLLRTLSMEINNPPVTLVSAAGSLRWWKDSLQLDFPDARLPSTRASVKGAISWLRAGPANVALDIRSDSIGVSDVRWMSALFPTEGLASADVQMRTRADGAFIYNVRAFDLRAFDSRLTGAVRITPGARTEMRGLSVAMQPLELDLVRNIFGDSILKPAWRGALNGRVTASGGFLDSLVIDSVHATYTDARTRGGQSRLRASGAMDVSGLKARLIGMQVTVDSMDIHTVGAVARIADSLSGALTGRLVLNGPTDNVRFTELHLRHIDEPLQPSVVTGSGRIASDLTSKWLEAELSLDTIAIATLAGGKTTAPIRGTVGGTLGVYAIGDTMWLDARLRAGDGQANLAGTTLLDSLRTKLDLAGTMAGLDPSYFLARRDLPAMSLSGTVRIALDDDVGQVDRHLELHLDTTSKVGASRLLAGSVRLGYDATGFHLDTADVRAAGWAIEARGQLARTGVAADSLTFAATIDSLGALSSILLDSTGAPRFKDLEGRIKTTEGVVRGSFDTASLRTLIGGSDLRFGETRIKSVVGDVTLTDLPNKASGVVRGTLLGVSSGAQTLDSVSLIARVAGGERARVGVRAAVGDSVDLGATADVTYRDSTYTALIDSLTARVSNHRWNLATPAQVRIGGGVTSVDSLILRSDAGASVIGSLTLGESGPINAQVGVRELGVQELSFLNMLPADLVGRINGTVTIAGTRDAPTLTARATVDSVRSGEEGLTRPSLTATARYATKRLSLDVAGTVDGRKALELTGDVPLDLSLRAVESRIIDAPMTLRFRADSLGLAAFEGIAPRVTQIAGRLDAALDIGGTLRRPRGRGTVTIVDGAFDVPRYGIETRGLAASLELAGDSVLVKQFRLADTDSPRDTAAISGVVLLAGNRWSDWSLDLHTVASRFRVIDDSRLASVEADWQLAVGGFLGEPRVTGNVQLPYAVFTIGPTRRSRTPTVLDSVARLGIPSVNGVVVAFGNDVRLKSREANVQLAGALELFGPLDRPWISGSVNATRGTYRVDLGPIKRTFRVDSGVVILEGTPDTPAALDIHTSYVVRLPDDDVTIGARLYGTTDRPRLALTSDLGSATSQSEIVSYLVFGQATFGLPGSRGSATQTAQAALVPSLGGLLEGVLGTVLPFFNTLQVSTVANEGSTNLVTNPLNVFNSFVVTGGRQVGSDSFFSLSSGICRNSRTSSNGGAPFWVGTAAEYRPKRTVGAQLSIDPGPAPCSRVRSLRDTYQFGLDLTYDWRFNKR